MSLAGASAGTTLIDPPDGVSGLPEGCSLVVGVRVVADFIWIAVLGVIWMLPLESSWMIWGTGVGASGPMVVALAAALGSGGANRNRNRGGAANRKRSNFNNYEL